MDEIIDGIQDAVGPYLPRIAGAIAILIVGWIVAVILSGITKRLLHRTDLDNRIAAVLRGGDGGASDEDAGAGAEDIASRGVFFLVMAFVVVAALEALALTTVTEPLNEALTEITRFAPNLLGAGLLLVAAWIVARIVRTVLTTAFTTLDLDRRLGTPADAVTSMSGSLAEAGYWLVFLFFLPAILDALDIDGLLVPVQNMVDSVLVFLPNAVAAAIILGVGWFAATLVRRIASNLLAAVGANDLGERVGIGAAGGMRLSDLVGLVLYALIFIPVIVAALNALQLEAVAAPTSNMLDSLLAAVPNIFAAVLVLAIAYFVARIVADLVGNILAGAGFDGVTARLGFADQPPVPPSRFVGMLVLTAIMVVAAMEAANLLGFALLSTLVATFVVFAGQVLLGVVIVGVGLLVANFLAGLIRASGANQANLLAQLARAGILVLATAMGLRQMGVANEIVILAFGLPLAALSIAAAVAIGLGGRDVAAQEIDRLRTNIRSGQQG